MAYRPDASGSRMNSRDKAYPSQIAAERPMCAPRIHCDETNLEPDDSLRGGVHEMHVSERVETFNRHLREGLGTGRPDNNDE